MLPVNLSNQVTKNPKLKTYAGIAVIFLSSLPLYYFLPSGEFFSALAAAPAVCALLAALFQLVRDQAEYERKLTLANLQNTFTLGATSHMANVAFDKHVLFSEEYVEEVHKTLTTLIRSGPSAEVLSHASTLFLLRQKYAVWLTTAIEQDLERFESALREIGANSHYVSVELDAADRSQRIDALYKTFADVMGSKYFSSGWQGEKLSEELAVSMIIRTLRTILGTEELTQMRIKFVKNALGDVSQS